VNWQQKASSAATFLLPVSLAAMAEKCKGEETSGVSVFGLVGSKQAATLHFMSASRILPLQSLTGSLSPSDCAKYIPPFNSFHVSSVMMLRLREEHENSAEHALTYFSRLFSQESLTGTTGLLACSKPPAGRPPARPDQPRPGHCAPTAQSPRHDVPPQIPGQTPDKPQDSERQESHGRRNPKIISCGQAIPETITWAYAVDRG
jgi:hypothetical protein